MNSIHALQRRSGGVGQIIVGLALAATLLALWALTHRFIGLQRDGNLYAFQALAKIYPNLNADIYLAFNSQDNYTIFSPIYAFFIAHSSLQIADLGLFLCCAVLYFSAAFFASRTLFGTTVACFTVIALTVISGRYGGYDVFSYSEDYLTARSLAVAMVAASLALHCSGRRALAGIAAVVAMFVHPIMALPCCFLLLGLYVPLRVCVISAASGCLAVLGLAYLASSTAEFARYLPQMDHSWLEVVHERSQFLFLQFWRPADWEGAARPFVSLTLTALVITDIRIRKLCVVAILIGASGLLVAWIGGSIGPAAILVQGQAWRWTWLTSFIAVWLFAPTALTVWRDPTCGSLAGILLVLGWTWSYSGVDNLLLTELSLSLWLIKHRITARLTAPLKWTAAAVVLMSAGWMIWTGWSYITSKTVNPEFDTRIMSWIRGFSALGISAAVIGGCTIWLLVRTRSATLHGGLLAALLVALIFVVPSSLGQSVTSSGTLREIAEFANWRAQIPATSNVLIVPLPINAAFAWFTLNRPSYISVDQSSGVVFARATAAEIRRRSEVLLPIADPDWKIMTRINAKMQGKQPVSTLQTRLTPEALTSVCTDPQLGFVIAYEDLGYAISRHDQPGTRKDWYLYDCARIRPPLQHS